MNAQTKRAAAGYPLPVRPIPCECGTHRQRDILQQPLQDLPFYPIIPSCYAPRKLFSLATSTSGSMP